MSQELTTDILRDEAGRFATIISQQREPVLYGVTDGKAIGTWVEHRFREYLSDRYTFQKGNSASGIDFPGLGVDMKVTSIRQPQSSCPFKSARQKVYGLGYSLLVFVYDKTDDAETSTGRLQIIHSIFVDERRTADYQMTVGITRILEDDGNLDDLVAFMQDRYLPVDDIQARQLAEEIVRNPPELGYLTISNALQWRLQYSRVIEQAGAVTGVIRITGD